MEYYRDLLSKMAVFKQITRVILVTEELIIGKELNPYHD